MISVLILTKNEEQDLPACLASVAWSEDIHVFDRWCYLGTAINENELAELLEDGAPEFDLDIYKIIKKMLKETSNFNILNLHYHQGKADMLPLTN